MLKYFIFLVLFATSAFASNNDVSNARQDIGSMLNTAVTEIRVFMSNTASGLTGAKDQDSENKKNLVHLEEMASEEESNPTVLNHAKKAIPKCDYKNKNLVWDGSSWKCITMNVDTECQAPAPDEYMYKDSNGNNVCAKSPKGSSISYYFQFRTYSSKCLGASQGYEKLYDCKYTNKLGKKIEVSSSYCSGKSKPNVAKKACKRNWTVGSWGSCSKQCGGGIKSRSVYCEAGYDCSSYKKPGSTTSCNTQKCKGDWIKSAWSSCSAKACGTSGTQTRKVYCPANLDCTATKKPTTTQKCSAAACPTCTWSTGSWSACSATACGTSGTKTRSVWKSGPSNCVGPTTPAPSKTTACSAAKCNYTYSWSYGNYGACSAAACGTSGKQTRPYKCLRSDGKAVSYSYCKGSPLKERSCSAKACNYTYSWSYGNYGACSATACGTSGKQTRSYKCVRSDGKTVSNSYCKGSPVKEKSCSAKACSYTYAWNYGGWSSCSATACGTSGKQTRSYKCVRSDGATVSNSYCKGSPYYQKACAAPKCNYTYQWSYGGWGSCSAAACGSGKQTRSYKCLRSDGRAVSYSYCKGAPYYQKSCSTPCKSCTIKHPIGWSTGYNSQCVEYYQPAGKGARTSQLPHNAQMTYHSSYGGRGSITIKCTNGSFRVVKKKCSGKIGGITESIQ